MLAINANTKEFAVYSVTKLKELCEEEKRASVDGIKNSSKDCLNGECYW